MSATIGLVPTFASNQTEITNQLLLSDRLAKLTLKRRPLFSDNSMVFYTHNSLATGSGGVTNSRHKARKT